MITLQPTSEFVELTTDDGRLHHLRALDGLRGLAVLGVLFFHLELPGFVGGFLGVSTFFTLSGFLITSLLLESLQRSDRVDLRGFWSGRGRRLLAASLATIFAVVVIFGHLTGTPDQRAGLRGDALGSVLQVANWHSLMSGSSYGRLFSAPSPLMHFWSLAVEEQSYLLLPLLLGGLWVAFRGRKVLLGAVLAGLALLSALEPIIFNMSIDRIYYGTDTRAVEVLVGAVLAVVLSHRLVRRRLELRSVQRLPVMVGGALALCCQMWWWWGLEHRTDWLYRGGFALYSLMTCLVICAAVLPVGPVHRVLSAAKLRWIGTRSFGLYLVHWPIYLLVRQTWPDLWTPARVVVSLGASFAVAEASFRWLEQPIRAGRWPARGRGAVSAVGAMSAVVVVALLPMSIERTLLTMDFERSAAEFADLGTGEVQGGTDSEAPSTSGRPSAPAAATIPTTSVPKPGTLPLLPAAPSTGSPSAVSGSLTRPTPTPTPAPTPPTPSPPAPPSLPTPTPPRSSVPPGAPRVANPTERTATTGRAAPSAPPSATSASIVVPAPTVGIFGDSTGLLLGLGLDEWSRTQRDALRVVGGSADLGCGVSRFARIRAVYDAPPMDKCVRWPQNWSAEMVRRKPNMALIVTGAWEVPDVMLPGSGRFSNLLEPATAAFVRNELIAAVDLLAAKGSLVVLVTWPRYASWASAGQSRAIQRQHEPARMDQLHRIEREVAAARPNSTRLLDLAGWLGSRSEDRRLRPDGIHIPSAAIGPIATEWMAPQLNAMWSSWWRGRNGLAP